MSKRIARLDWSLWVECPECKEDNDLSEGDHDTENSIALAIFNNKWGDLNGWEVMCEKCEHEFEISGVEY